jgi:galactokinase
VTHADSWVSEELKSKWAQFFTRGVPITVTRAPGRLDVMGGVADYSGSVVLEAPLARATLCAAQPCPDQRVRVRSDDIARERLVPYWEGTISSLLVAPGETYADVRRCLTDDKTTAWAAYAAGVVTVLHAAGHLRHPTGLSLFLSSDVPLGGGVSSSASLEVAAMTAVCAAVGLRLEGLELARLCQQVENQVVGAPCGIMDQVSCALGQAGRLIAIRCRPCEVLGYPLLPENAALFGIHSDVKHSVGGSRYTRARVAAFMGLKLIQSLEAATPPDYLCDMDPQTFRERYYTSLPARILGAAFLAEHGETGDPVTQIDPAENYPVRGAVEHAVYENHRVQQFIKQLERATRYPKALEQAGRLMYASHWSYGHRIGLGAPETDLLVRLAREAGPNAGVYGAKITGGGSGGSVALLTSPDARPVVERIAAEYGRRTGLKPEILEGTSPGAIASGHQRLVL